MYNSNYWALTSIYLAIITVQCGICIGKGRTRDDVHRYLYIAYFDYDRASEKEVGNLIFCKSNKLA